MKALTECWLASGNKTLFWVKKRGRKHWWLQFSLPPFTRDTCDEATTYISGKLNKCEAPLSSHSLIPDGSFGCRNVLPQTAFEDVASFFSTWYPKSSLSWEHKAPLFPMPSLTLLTLSGTKQWSLEEGWGVSTFERFIFFLPLSSHPFALTLCYSRVLTSYNDAWHLPNDAWALLWHSLSKYSWNGMLLIRFDAFPVETEYLCRTCHASCSQQ